VSEEDEAAGGWFGGLMYIVADEDRGDQMDRDRETHVHVTLHRADGSSFRI